MYLQPTHMLVAYPVLTKRTAEHLKTTPVRRLLFFSFVYILHRGEYGRRLVSAVGKAPVKSCLCNDISKWLEFLFFSDKEEKP